MTNANTTVWLWMTRKQIVLTNGNYRHAEQPPSAAVFLPVGKLLGAEWRMALLEDDALHDNPLSACLESTTLRSFLGQVAEDEFALLSRASQLQHWWLHHQFCGQCGTKNILHDAELALSCRACSVLYYPRISPCVIMLVTRGKQCLLAKHTRSSRQRYSCLAGFIEVGESAEATVVREVAEEVGLRVNNLRYITSQNWPFPSQLMLGFLVDYSAGDIAIDGVEIEDAAWFNVDNLPEIPPEGTISRFLIDHFCANQA
ncbi:MAG: NAD(+) diphosphatase [Marinagarivorans sp.]|nr:NAD(+) diphosphatase [Marinagarivorans sp.]